MGDRFSWNNNVNDAVAMLRKIRRNSGDVTTRRIEISIHINHDLDTSLFGGKESWYNMHYGNFTTYERIYGRVRLVVFSHLN